MNLKSPRALFVSLALLLALAGAVAVFFRFRRAEPPPSTELATPRLALDYLKSFPPENKKLFFTGAASAFLPGSRELLAQRARENEACLWNPKAWRALDRRERFDALLLTGDPVGFRPLLEHLRQSTDWKLAWVDPTSLVFRRAPAPEWKPDDLKSLKAAFATHSRAEQGVMRVQTAHRLIAFAETAPAKALLDEATALNPRSGPAWAELASWYATQGRWDKALELSERALRYEKHYTPALTIRAEALFAYGKFDDALDLARHLLADAPSDGPTLYLHAKIAHAAHAYSEEIETLLKIVAMAESQKLPAGQWRLFLAQAYAATGQREAALEQFKAALKEPGITGREREFAEKGLERLQGSSEPGR